MKLFVDKLLTQIKYFYNVIYFAPGNGQKYSALEAGGFIPVSSMQLQGTLKLSSLKES